MSESQLHAWLFDHTGPMTAHLFPATPTTEKQGWPEHLDGRDLCVVDMTRPALCGFMYPNKYRDRIFQVMEWESVPQPACAKCLEMYPKVVLRTFLYPT